MKSVIFTTFFAILSQESYQNLMWKVDTSFNLNLPLKLFFYSSILANNNLLLKIYCENIVVTFLNCHFLFFILFFLSLFHSYFFFPWFFLHHTCIPLLSLSTLLFLFLVHYRSLSSAISLSLSLSLSLFLLFLFPLDSRTLSPSISHKQILSHTHIDHRQRSGDRRYAWFFFFISFILLFRFH